MTEAAERDRIKALLDTQDDVLLYGSTNYPAAAQIIYDAADGTYLLVVTRTSIEPAAPAAPEPAPVAPEPAPEPAPKPTPEPPEPEPAAKKQLSDGPAPADPPSPTVPEPVVPAVPTVPVKPAARKPQAAKD